MPSLLDQLYQSKLQLIAVVSVVGGVGLLILAQWLDVAALSGWVRWLPVGELGTTLFSTGLLAIFFEYVDRKHGEQRAAERVREAVRQEAPAIRDAVLNSFAFEPAKLRNVASVETLDRITANALGLRLGDQELAAELYVDTRNQVIHSPERWRDVDVSVMLTPWNGGPTSGPGSMLVATIRWEYRTTPANPTLRFACVSDPEQYRELIQDPAMTGTWHFDASAGLDVTSKEVFEVVQSTVNGRERPIHRSRRKGAQLYSVPLGDELDQGQVTVSFTYRVLVQRHGHLLYLEVPKPSRNFKVQFSHQGCGIRRVNALDFIASERLSRVQELPSPKPSSSVSIGVDGWVFPRSGVAFVWVLEEEMARARGKKLASNEL
ncbi:hypothetical protein GCM10027569_72330 [Flindersiella endophytica]